MLTTPGVAPPRFTHTSRTARPIVAFARQPGPKTPAPQLTSSAPRTGPLRTRSGLGEFLVADGLDGGDDDRQVLGPASRHHRVDRDLLDGCPAVVRRHQCDQLAGAPPRCAYRAAHTLRRGRDDGQAVGETAR